MHSPRIPLDFDFPYAGYGRWHIASGDTSAFWFGMIMMLGMAWNLRQGLRKGGEFGLFPIGPADRDHPVTFWTAAAIHAALLLIGAYFVLCGLIGLTPFGRL
ncbi:MAG: hypothetical protein JOZ72_05810 [Alphaproteobacteria bacterium]|nr:hypothetical protein [Alphaproteobacteria bacterium]